MRRLTISALLMAVLPLCAAAQGTSDRGQLSPRIYPAFGVHYGTPLRLSAVVGIIVDLDANSRDGLLVVAEPGREGFGYSVGYLRMVGRYGSGYSVRATVLRTSDRPWEANADATYAGAELHWMIILGAGGRAGLFRRVGGTAGPHDTLGTLGISLGI